MIELSRWAAGERRAGGRPLAGALHFIHRSAMAEETAAAVAPAPASPKKGKKSGGAKLKKTKASPSHPKVSVMVPAAIAALKERGGSSLQAIKKYVGSTYKVDVERLAPFIKKYLKSAVESGALLQTKGKGASGSFKLKSSAPKVSSEARPTKTASAPKPKKASSSPKKAPAKSSKAPAAEKKANKASPKKKARKPAKAKPAKKAAKPKAPKPKKAKTPTKKAAKK